MFGLFITIEGTDGAGKSTQSKLLLDYFKKRGNKVILIREPGGTIIGEKIRNIILDIENKDMNNITEALLYAASRAQLVNQVILPKLKDDNIVICDRFVDSSIVYQGIARNIGISIIKEINNIATGGLTPNITFFLDLPPSKSIIRKKEQKPLDRLESEKEHFYKKVYEGYKLLVEQNANRIKVIDALKSIDEIHKNIIDYF